MTTLKTLVLAATLAMAGVTATLAGEAKDVGRFTVSTESLGTVSVNAVVTAVPDPDVRGVTCFVTSMERKGFTMESDPSDSSVACRQTGALFKDDLAKLKAEPAGEDVFSESKGGLGKSLFTLWKTLRLRRIYDAENQTLLYVTYTTRAMNSSYKISTSAVNLYGQTLQ